MDFAVASLPADRRVRWYARASNTRKRDYRRVSAMLPREPRSPPMPRHRAAADSRARILRKRRTIPNQLTLDFAASADNSLRSGRYFRERQLKYA